jgi:hypothetical protein
MADCKIPWRSIYLPLLHVIHPSFNAVLPSVVLTFAIENRYFFSHGSTVPSEPRLPHCWGFGITLRHTTFCRTPLDEWFTRRTDLYLTIHNTPKRQTSMPVVGFEPAVPVIERLQTHVLDRASTGCKNCRTQKFLKYKRINFDGFSPNRCGCC